MKRFSPLVVLAACNFSASMGGPDAAIDASADAEQEIDAMVIDALDLCIGEGASEVCLEALPTTPIEFGNNVTIDTSLAETCTTTTNAQAAEWCVIAGTRLHILNGTIVRVIGTKPVVFATTGEMLIAGTIEVSSRGNAVGPGANPSACTGGTPATEGNSSGGGFGGSFGGRGANGESADGGGGGIAPAAVGTVVTLRGGCAGGAGGPIGGTRAAGGAGGGALALLTRTSILLPGTLNASGAGGRVGELVRQGSGGGGSGGMIVLDALSIDASGGNIFANGGGGGEGNDLVNVGVAGLETFSPSVPAAGGSGTSSGGDGGAGSLGGAGGIPPMNASSSNAGGGGGGGGAGVIRSSVVLTGANVSPTPL
jgi:hypothetical protein